MKALTLAAIAAALSACGPQYYRTEPLETLRMVQRNPKAHVGDWHWFEGEVFSIEEGRGQIVFQMAAKNPGRSEYEVDSEMIAVLYPSTEPPIVKGNCVRVYGQMGSPLDGKNAFGAPVSLQTMKAIGLRVYRTDYDCRLDLNGADFYLAKYRDAWDVWAGRRAAEKKP